MRGGVCVRAHMCVSVCLTVRWKKHLCRCALRGCCALELLCRSCYAGVLCCLCCGRHIWVCMRAPVSAPVQAPVCVTVCLQGWHEHICPCNAMCTPHVCPSTGGSGVMVLGVSMHVQCCTLLPYCGGCIIWSSGPIHPQPQVPSCSGAGAWHGQG